MIMVAGLDISVASTGVAVMGVDGSQPPDPDGRWPVWRAQDGSPMARCGVVRPSAVGTPKSVSARRDRLVSLALDIVDQVGQPPELLVVEQPVLYDQHGGAVDLVGAWWLTIDAYCAWYAHRAGHSPDIMTVPPSTLKLYLAGTGRASKAAMVDAVRADHPWFALPAGVGARDAADAVGLAAIGARILGHPVDRATQARARAMNTVTRKVKTK